jgi:hypothetical protein
MVAANGDTIAFSCRGTFEPTGPTTVTFQTTGVITGGTGRYAGATGGATSLAVRISQRSS